MANKQCIVTCCIPLSTNAFSLPVWSETQNTPDRPKNLVTSIVVVDSLMAIFLSFSETYYPCSLVQNANSRLDAHWGLVAVLQPEFNDTGNSN